MADKSKIEWTNATWNPIRGCSVVTEGCRNCYAMRYAARFNQPGQAYEGLAYRNESGAHWTGEVKLIEEHLEDPLRWKRPRRIFVNSMSDLFHESIPDEWIDRIFAVMALAPQHKFQVLTKRPERMLDYIARRNSEYTDLGVSDYAEEVDCDLIYDCGELKPHLQVAGWWFDWDHDDETGKRCGGRPYYNGPIPLPNVWLGVSCEDQKTADERIPLLLKTPAAVRWISAEPLIAPVDVSIYLASGYSAPPFVDILDWVVVGGESGPDARPMHPDWARSLRDQCVAAGVPFFFKQWGEWENDYDLSPEQWVERGGDPAQAQNGPTHFQRVGKKAAGRLLDGREWNEYPGAGR